MREWLKDTTTVRDDHGRCRSRDGRRRGCACRGRCFARTKICVIENDSTIVCRYDQILCNQLTVNAIGEPVRECVSVKRARTSASYTNDRRRVMRSDDTDTEHSATACSVQRFRGLNVHANWTIDCASKVSSGRSTKRDRCSDISPNSRLEDTERKERQHDQR